MFTTIITDCKSENARGRQETRFNSLELGPTSTIGVSSRLDFDATIEAAGNLIDILDASEGKKGVVMVNVAPRGDKKDGINGTQFCYFYHKQTLVISTIKGYCLSLIKKLKLVKKVNLLELREALKFAQKKNLISKQLSNHIINSQFRSFDFIPKVARWILDGINIPSSPLILDSCFTIPNCIWSIDAFGNAKTTLLTDNLKLNTKNPKLRIKTNLGIFKFYQRLKDIPRGKTAIYIGSSGIENHRFLEITTQAVSGSAAKNLKLQVGTKIEILYIP